MRNELQTIEIIEQYLNNEMNAQEKAAFETEIQNSPTLKKQLKIQELLKQAVARQAIKKDILQHSPSSGFNFAKWIGIITGVVLIAVLSWMVIEQKTNTTETPNQQNIEVVENADSATKLSATSEETVVTNQNDDTVYVQPSFRIADTKEQIKKDAYEGLNTWIDPIVQTVMIDPAKGATIEGKDGTLIIVPANAFVHADGSLVIGPVTLEIIEALKVSDMVAYNLTTMNGDKTLQSGGMLYLQPYLNGEKIRINPERPLYIEIPTDTYNPEMKAWKGVVNEKGNIDWQNPKNLEKFLTRIDFENLDFLPSGFENAVKAGMPFKSYKTANKELVDSLYYALHSDMFKNNNYDDTIIDHPFERYEIPTTRIRSVLWGLIPIGRTSSSISTSEKRKIRVSKNNKKQQKIETCHIDPVSIKTIRTEEFSNTYIATKEFEERIRILHTIKNSQKYLEIYINNLDKDLRVADQMIANKMIDSKYRKIFSDFAAQNLTNVKKPNIYQTQLSAYYNSKKKELTDQINEQRAEYAQKNEKELLDLKKELEVLKNGYSNMNYSGGYYVANETKKTVKYQAPSSNVVSARNTYTTTWFQSGWMNIDAYLKLISNNSVSVEIKADISKFQDGKSRIYQCLNVLKTVVPLNIQNGKCIAKFPNKGLPEAKQMEKTFTIGIIRKNTILFYSEIVFNPYNHQPLELKWQEISQAVLKEKLSYLNYTQAIEKLIDHEISLVNETIRIEQRRKLLENEIKEQQSKVEEKEKQLAAERTFMQSLWNVVDLCKERLSENTANELEAIVE